MVSIHQGDALALLRQMPDQSVDAVVTADYCEITKNRLMEELPWQ